MSVPVPNPVEPDVADLAARVAAVLRCILDRDAGDGIDEFEHLIARADELVTRKLAMRGTKSATRDLLAEVAFGRLRRSFRDFLKSADPKDEIRAAEWVLGAAIGGSALQEFGAAIDSAILKGAGPKDYSFAGRCDFIALEEVLQMLGAGKHCGCLSLEKHDNRVDIYIKDGRIAFLDPHHIVRRVLPGRTAMDYREISAATMARAEKRHSEEGIPVFVTLAEENILHGLDVRNAMRMLGAEVLFDFLLQQEDSHFLYRRLGTLPSFVGSHDLRLGVTPVLLELSKRLDEWRSMENAFPDPSAPIEPMPDMLSRISELSLGVLEIKLLSAIDGDTSANALTEITGLPLFEVYQLLVTFAREGAIVPPGGAAALLDVQLSAEESLETAMEVLEANDDQVAVNSVLDRVLGGGDDGGFGFG